MGCATTTVKICSVVFNVILACFAVSAIIWISFNPDALDEEKAIGAYVACSLIVVFAFLGCFAAIRESVCLTATCAVFLLLLAVLQIALMCVDWGDGGVRDGIATVDRAWESNAMDAIQEEHECCGKTSAQDYILVDRRIPASCYMDKDASNVNNLFIDGCSGKLQTYFERETWRFAVVFWSLVAFELVGFLLAVFLVVNFRNTQRRMQF